MVSGCFVAPLAVRSRRSMLCVTRSKRTCVVCASRERDFAEALAARAAAAARRISDAARAVGASGTAESAASSGQGPAPPQDDEAPPPGFLLDSKLDEAWRTVRRSLDLGDSFVAAKEAVAGKVADARDATGRVTDTVGAVADAVSGRFSEAVAKAKEWSGSGRDTQPRSGGSEDGASDSEIDSSSVPVSGDHADVSRPTSDAASSGERIVPTSRDSDSSSVHAVEATNISLQSADKGIVEFEGGSAARSSSVLNDILALATGGAGEAVVAALDSTLQSVRVGFDEDGVSGGDDAIVPPKYPLFDAVTALLLAGYAFQAYLEPARGAYWESHSVRVAGSEVSHRKEQTIATRIAFPSAESIAKTARGVFMIQVKNVDPETGLKPLDEKFFVTAMLNDAGFHSNILKDGSSYFSLLSPATDPVSGSTVAATAQQTLLLSVYESEQAYSNGATKIGTASVALTPLVEKGVGQPGGARGDLEVVMFEGVSEEDANDNFFEFNLLPEGMQLPFGTALSGEATRVSYSAQVVGSCISVQCSYVSFDMQSAAGNDELEDDEDWPEDDEEETSEMQEEEALTISQIMASGGMPLQWKKLAKELTALLKELEKSPVGLSDRTLGEDLPKSMYISSPETDSEVWLFHDDKMKRVVVSFRGTEQAKWKDFVTDSLIFLQAWKPGEPIVLDIVAGRTMGLDLWDVVRRGSKEGQDDDVSAMSCVHWGFLRAYHSLRDALDVALSKLTSGFDEGYQFFFTGHSLGGALATLAACDLQARRGGDNACLDICMMNFGSPRVGNRSFAVEFNRLVPNAFRVVNGADLVARMPQSSAGMRGGFRHAGRTCLVDESGSVWVQGESDEDADETSFPAQKVETLKQLLDREREMWSLLISGQSLGHHLEDSYFISLRTVVRKLLLQ